MIAKPPPVEDPPSVVRIATVEDDRRYRSSLATLFAHAQGFAFGRGFSYAEEALRLARRGVEDGEGPPWDLLLMDLALPGMDGITATRKMKELVREVPIVVVTAFDDPPRVLDAICSGADGYLTKRTRPETVLEELRSILSGGAPLSAGVARTVLDLLRLQAPSARALVDQASGTPLLVLTDREEDVLRGLVEGRTYREIGDDLDISLDTVRTHVRRVYRKLHVHNVAQAVRVALEHGLI